MTQTYIGIDPGKMGAVAALDERGQCLGVWDTPTVQIKKGKAKRAYLPIQMAEILRKLDNGGNIVAVGLELVHAMPGQGVSTMFSMGRGVGTWEGIIAALGIPLEMITPQRWKKALLSQGVGNDKQASVVKALALIPSSAPYLTLKKHSDRAEAILICEFLRRTRTGQV